MAPTTVVAPVIGGGPVASASGSGEHSAELLTEADAGYDWGKKEMSRMASPLTVEGMASLTSSCPCSCTCCCILTFASGIRRIVGGRDFAGKLFRDFFVQRRIQTGLYGDVGHVNT